MTTGATFVFEYALNHTASPALIAQYQTRLPDKALLQSKLHEFYLQNVGVERSACEDDFLAVFLNKRCIALPQLAPFFLKVRWSIYGKQQT